MSQCLPPTALASHGGAVHTLILYLFFVINQVETWLHLYECYTAGLPLINRG